MKNLFIMMILLIGLGCQVEEIQPQVGSTIVTDAAGFNDVTVNLSFEDTAGDIVNVQAFVVYSKAVELKDGVVLYTDAGKTIRLQEGLYTYTINPVFYNLFQVDFGIVSELEVRTF